MIWVDGAIYAAHEARVDPEDRGVLLGDGLFETVRAVDGRPVRWREHFARLRHGAELLELELPYALESLEAVMVTLLRAEGLDFGTACVRLTCTRGAVGRGLAPAPARGVVMLRATCWRPLDRPCRLHTVSVRRDERSPLSGIKHTSGLQNLLARREAVSAGADEALLLNTLGEVAEASAANIFAVCDGEVLTPHLAAGALPGVMRGVVLRAADELGVRSSVCAVSLDLLHGADEIFLTNALVGVWPVSQLDGRVFEAPGPLTRVLRRKDSP